MTNPRQYDDGGHVLADCIGRLDTQVVHTPGDGFGGGKHRIQQRLRRRSGRRSYDDVNRALTARVLVVSR